MTPRLPDSLERLTHTDLIGAMRDLVHELGSENERLEGVLAKLRIEHQAVRDELARLKHLPIKPSGMEKSTPVEGSNSGRDKSGRSTRMMRESSSVRLT